MNYKQEQIKRIEKRIKELLFIRKQLKKNDTRNSTNFKR
tara:strand:- start:13 stop:129 length:117 start_codon:yes stop_codon:yes gene_type:complete